MGKCCDAIFRAEATDTRIYIYMYINIFVHICMYVCIHLKIHIVVLWPWPAQESKTNECQRSGIKETIQKTEVNKKCRWGNIIRGFFIIIFIFIGFGSFFYFIFFLFCAAHERSISVHT